METQIRHPLLEQQYAFHWFLAFSRLRGCILVLHTYCPLCRCLAFIRVAWLSFVLPGFHSCCLAFIRVAWLSFVLPGFHSCCLAFIRVAWLSFVLPGFHSCYLAFIPLPGFHSVAWLSFRCLAFIPLPGFHSCCLAFIRVAWLSFVLPGFHSVAWLSFRCLAFIPLPGFHSVAWLSFVLPGFHSCCLAFIRVAWLSFLDFPSRKLLVGTSRYEDGKARTTMAVDAGNFRGSGRRVAKNKMLKMCISAKDGDVNNSNFVHAIHRGNFIP